MSILIKDFNGSNPIHFREEYHTTEMVLISINCISLFLGIVLETLVIVALLRIRLKTVDNLFVLSLCCADLVFNLYMFPSVVIVLAAAGWSVGVIGCKVSVSMIIATLGTSILSLTFITLNRYMAIIWKTNITRQQSLLMIGFGWIFFPIAIVSFCLPHEELSNISVSLQSSYSYCFLDFSSRDPIVVSIMLGIILFMAIPLIFIIVAYSQIILFYRKMNRIREYVTSQVYKSERKLFIKAVAITSAFVITYSIELIIRVYEFSSKSHISPVVDLISTIGICANTLLNSIILLKYDALVQSSALELLGLDKWWKKRKRPVVGNLKKPRIANIQMKDKIKRKDEELTNTTQNEGPNSLATQRIIKSN